MTAAMLNKLSNRSNDEHVVVKNFHFHMVMDNDLLL